MRPSLNARDLEHIDALIAREPMYRGKLPQPGVRDLVYTTEDLRPQMYHSHGHDGPEERFDKCGSCGTRKPYSELLKCSRCRAQLYCNKARLETRSRPLNPCRRASARRVLRHCRDR